MVIDAFNL
jgi:hypothetical protein